MKRKILYYAQVGYLDISIEFIKLLSEKFEVCVLIELNSSRLNSNILNLNLDLDSHDNLVSYDSIKKAWGLEYLESYFSKCNFCKFVIYKSSNRVSNFIRTTRSVIKIINSEKFDFIHLDDYSPRQAFFLPFLKCKKILLNVHDATPHHGEFNWKRYFLKKIIYSKARRFVLFSKFSKSVFDKQFQVPPESYVLRFLPYSVFKNFGKNVNLNLIPEENYISFVGRVSPYKGIEIFMKAIKMFLLKYPNQKFVIAGNPIPGYIIDKELLSPYENEVTFILRHLSNDEIAGIIRKSKLLVCPYIEASQSGVIMTSFALECPVLVTNVGGLPEYVDDNFTGLIADVACEGDLYNEMVEFASTDMQLKLKGNIKSNVQTLKDIEYNNTIFDNIYL